jgi:hypothetical protein
MEAKQEQKTEEKVSAADAAQEQTAEAAAETQADSQPEEKKEEGVRSKRRKQEKAEASGFFSRLNNINQDIGAKYPKLAKKIDYFKEVWAETFPNSDVQINNKMERRRQQARMQRE